MSEKQLAIIVPCYNESKRLAQEVFYNFVEENPLVHIFFANDGSSDDTKLELERLSGQHEQLHLIDFLENQGKGEVIRQSAVYIMSKEGVSFEWIGFLDADLATPLEEMLRLLEFQKPESQLIMGTRFAHMGSEIQRKWYRHYPGRVIATFISIILGLEIYDTQCGAKWMRPSLIEQDFESPFITPWLFDVEMIKRIVKREGIPAAKKCMQEIPLNTWIEMGDSKITLLDFMKTPIDLLRIYLHYR